MHKTAALVVLLACPVIALAACGGGREVRVQRAAAPAVPDSIYVEIVNNYFYDARMYALYGGGARYPLGIVVGKGEVVRAAIPWQPRRLTFDIYFIGESTEYYSDDLDLEPGDVVQLTIPPNIASSAFFRRR